MTPDEIRQLREVLSLSRAALARFLGVAEMTIVRWEAGTESSPRGLQLVVLKALARASQAEGVDVVSRLVRDSAENQGKALQQLLSMAYESETPQPKATGTRRVK